MKLEMQVPSPGESINEVEIASWMKADGEQVSKDDELCEIESEKVSLTLYAEASGTLKILIPEGEVIAVGTVVCTIESNGATVPEKEVEKKNDSGKSVKKTQPQKEKKAAAKNENIEPVAVTVPSPGESINEVEIASWIKSDGDHVSKDEEICEIESEKVSLTLYAELEGRLKIKVEEGTTVDVGSVVAEITPGTAPSVTTKETVEESQKAEPQKEEISVSDKAVSPPSVVPERKLSRPSPDAKLSPETAASLDSQHRQTERKKLSQLRRKVAERLVSVKNETAMLTTFNEVDMSDVIAIRKRYKEDFKKAFDINLGFMSFFIRAVTISLRDYPAVNAQLDGEEIVYHDYADIGIAVSAPKGLMVPVIRNAEQLSFAEIEKSIAELADKARSGKITLDEMTGGTFTLTNGGIFGSMLSTPILNPPQVGILGMHNIVQRAVVIDGKVEIRPVMYLALSYDHRVIDGRESVGFLVRIKELIESPEKMLLGLPPITR